MNENELRCAVILEAVRAASVAANTPRYAEGPDMRPAPADVARAVVDAYLEARGRIIGSTTDSEPD